MGNQLRIRVLKPKNAKAADPKRAIVEGRGTEVTMVIFAAGVRLPEPLQRDDSGASSDVLLVPPTAKKLPRLLFISEIPSTRLIVNSVIGLPLMGMGIEVDP